MRRLALVLTCSALAPAGFAQRQTQATPTSASIQRAIESVGGFRRLTIPGTEVEKAVGRLTALTWHKSLRSALASGAAASKPVLWIQALGELDGFL